MRIHRLGIQAFGPFVQPQEVDFDRLAEQGLFLLEGATGAGKSSVLDAICFALFASVPGVRQSGQRLRSDHAPAELTPEVLLEFSISGRHLRIIRSPAWFRPAKRGSSMVRENAQALLSEKVDGEWLPLSTRNDEAAHQIEALLGMNREQFTKVVMLAQGEFAAFLRADVKERQVLLQQLFGTERFLALEQKLLETSASAQRKVHSVQQQLAELLQAARLQAADYLEAKTRPANSSEESTPAVEPSVEPEAEPWDFQRLLGAMTTCQKSLLRAAEQATEQAERAAVELSVAEDVAARHSELAAAESATEAVRESEAAQRERLRALEQHQAAQHFSSDVDRLRTAEERDATARQTGDDVWKKLEDRKTLVEALADAATGGSVADELFGERLESVAKRLSATAAVVRSLLPEEEQLLRQQGEHEAAVAGISAALQHQREATELSESLTAEQSALTTQSEAVSALSAALELRESALRTAEIREAAGADFRRTEGRLQALQGELRSAESAQLTAKAQWLALMQARLERAAGELAAGLVPGEPCPVCGSAEHPAPSELQGMSLQLVAEEEQAREANEQGEEALKSIQDAVNQASAERASFAAIGGEQEAAELADATATALAQLQESERARQHSQQYAEELQALGLRIKAAEEAAFEARTQSQELQARAASLQLAIAERRDKVVSWLGGHNSLSERLAEFEQDEVLLAAAIEAHRSAELAAGELAAARSAMAQKLAGSPFDSAPGVAAALRSAEEVAELNAASEIFRDAAIRAQQMLGTDRVRQAGEERRNGMTIPDAIALANLRAVSQQAAAQEQQALLHHQLCTRSIDAVQRAAAQHAELDSGIAPERKRAELLTALAETARGLGQNEFKMPLSAYVLAARLEQVAEAASERLQVMSDGRYLLAHTDALAGGNKKSGLGLEVIDGWTGQNRDTATLSGGESFMASLALALGLADVVQRESGGMRIDTLFVDEGFGSLDEESLEMVMTSLEGLRDSGRTVGLVSHVAELKLRIPQQLHVTKGRQGSTLSAQSLDRLE